MPKHAERCHKPFRHLDACWAALQRCARLVCCRLIWFQVVSPVLNSAVSSSVGTMGPPICSTGMGLGLKSSGHAGNAHVSRQYDSDRVSHRCRANHPCFAASICAVSDAYLWACRLKASLKITSMQGRVCSWSGSVHALHRGAWAGLIGTMGLAAGRTLVLPSAVGMWAVCRPASRPCNHCSTAAAASDLGFAQKSTSAALLPTKIHMLLPSTLASPTALKSA